MFFVLSKSSKPYYSHVSSGFGNVFHAMKMTLVIQVIWENGLVVFSECHKNVATA